MKPKTIKDIAIFMRDELDAGWLEVCKVPGRDGGYIRVCCSVNAEWYSVFCRRYLRCSRKFSKPRTLIKRCHTRHALERIASGHRRGVYVERLLEFIESWF